MVDSNNPFKPNMSSLAEHFSLVKEDVLHPVSYKTIFQYQQNNKPLIKTAKLNKDYSIKHFHGTDKKYSLICRKNKILIPKLLEKQVVKWYHNALCHPGETCMELSIAQHFYWKSLCKTVYDVCSNCKAFHILRKNKKQYRKLPLKEAEIKLWDVLCTDLIGQYQFTRKGGGKKYQMTTKNGKTVYLHTVTIIDPAIDWIEICTVPSALTDLVTNIVGLVWLTRYPLPSKVKVDRGNKFLVEFNTMIQADYGITVKPIPKKKGKLIPY